MQINEPEWMKSMVSAVVGAVGTAGAFLLRQDRRITRIEKTVERIDTTVEKAGENGERLARVETQVSSHSHILDRIDAKIDRMLQQAGRK